MAITYSKFPEVTKQIKDYFWSKVDINYPDQCWIWRGGTIPERGNYGRFYIFRKDFRAHRVAYYFYFGIDPLDKDVCHTCDNPQCVNPHHLFLGTRADNHKDMDKKGRRIIGLKLHPEKAAKGNSLPQAKMTPDTVLEARKLYNEGNSSQCGLARKYGICLASMQNILNRKTWKHI